MKHGEWVKVPGGLEMLKLPRYRERIVYGIEYHGLDPDRLYVVRTLADTGDFVSARPFLCDGDEP